MVSNPPHHTQGDFALQDGVLGQEGRKFTYAGIGLYSHQFFADSPEGAFPIRDLMIAGIERGVISAEVHEGVWSDVGTHEVLSALRLEDSISR